MAQAKKFTWGATGLAVAAVIAAFVMWIARSRQTSSAQDGARAAAPPPLLEPGEELTWWLEIRDVRRRRS